MPSPIETLSRIYAGTYERCAEVPNDKKLTYWHADVVQTAWRKESFIMYNGQVKKSNAFFTPYQGVVDFREQLRAPVVTFILSLTETFRSALDAVSQSALCVASMLVFNEEQAIKHATNVLINMLSAIYYAWHAVFDPLLELVSLATRSGASVASGIGSFIASFAKSDEVHSGNHGLEEVYTPSQ